VVAELIAQPRAEVYTRPIDQQQVAAYYGARPWRSSNRSLRSSCRRGSRPACQCSPAGARALRGIMLSAVRAIAPTRLPGLGWTT